MLKTFVDAPSGEEPITLPSSLFDQGVKIGTIKRKNDGYYWGNQRVAIPQPLPVSLMDRLKVMLSG